jgi:hypothetical protein
VSCTCSCSASICWRALGDRAFALPLFQRRVQAGAHAVAHQLQRLLALRQRALRHAQLVVQARQLEVAARDLAGQQRAGGIDIGLRGARRAQRGLQRLRVAAEEVDLPAGAQLQRAAFRIDPASGGGTAPLAV